MTTGPILDPRVLGRAQTAHQALLDAVLDEAGAGHHQWIAINISTLSPVALDRERLTARLEIATRVGPREAEAVVAELLASGLLEIRGGARRLVRATAAGLELQHKIRHTFDDALARLYAGIPAEDLRATSRTLNEITARIDAELLGRPPTRRELRFP